MTAADFDALLERLGACSEAREWARGKTASEVWATCERGDWMLWLAGRLSRYDTPERKAVVLAACDCAELALPIFERRYPGDGRPRKAIETARRYASGEATLDDVRAASAVSAVAAYAAYAADAASAVSADAASAADAAAYAADAASAAYAADAAYAAYAADAAYAAYAAADAADAADAARATTLRQCAEIVRRHVPTCPTGIPA